MESQAVIVNLPLQGAGGDFALMEGLGERLAERVEAAGAGEFDGDLIGRDWAVLYFYGPDADRLWAAMEDVLEPASLPPGSYVVKQHGPPGGPETRIELGPAGP